MIYLIYNCVLYILLLLLNKIILILLNNIINNYLYLMLYLFSSWVKYYCHISDIEYGSSCQILYRYQFYQINTFSLSV